MSSFFGEIFKIASFGESHGVAVGVVIEGLCGNFPVSLDIVQQALDRRRPAQSELVSTRKETDKVFCLSGMEDGISLGSPLCFIVYNKDAKSIDYAKWQDIYRPSHADYTTQIKYGSRAKSGGGRASARETIARVIAGSIAEQYLSSKLKSYMSLAYVEEIYDFTCRGRVNFNELNRDRIESSVVRCPDRQTSQKMQELISRVKSEGDSVGGVIRCIIRGVPAGLGEPVFDKLEASLAKAMLSIPAVRGFEIGNGFESTKKLGSQNNDAFIKNSNGNIDTLTNNSGGIQGGISNGNLIDLRVYFKPPATIKKNQQTVDYNGNEISMSFSQGRHDPCVLPRAVPIVEAMANIVLMDHYLMYLTSR